MNNISLLTVVNGQREQLHRLLTGVAKQTMTPREMVLVFINEPVPEVLPNPGCPIYLHEFSDGKGGLPIAAARNLAAASARGEYLAFLDQECIPASHYLERLLSAIKLTHGLVTGEIVNLPESFSATEWTDESLEDQANPDASPSPPPAGELLTALPYKRFRSSCFGLRAVDYARIGGYDELYRGHAADDADFAFSAREIKLQIFRCDSRVYRQFSPPPAIPYANLREVVADAASFYHKWQIWPMRKLLRRLSREGLIDLRKNDIQILRAPESGSPEEN